MDHYFNPDTYKPGEALKLQPSKQSVNLSKAGTDPKEESKELPSVPLQKTASTTPTKSGLPTAPVRTPGTLPQPPASTRASAGLPKPPPTPSKNPAGATTAQNNRLSSALGAGVANKYLNKPGTEDP
jgi:hypothetical protein